MMDVRRPVRRVGSLVLAAMVVVPLLVATAGPASAAWSRPRSSALSAASAGRVSSRGASAVQPGLARGRRRRLPELPAFGATATEVLATSATCPPVRARSGPRVSIRRPATSTTPATGKTRSSDSIGSATTSRPCGSVAVGTRGSTWTSAGSVDRERESAVDQLVDPALPQRRHAVELLDAAEHLPEGDDDLRDRRHLRRPRVPAGLQRPARSRCTASTVRRAR